MNWCRRSWISSRWWTTGSRRAAAPADTQILTDMDPVPPFAIKSSLPMCRYPNYPHYRGAGDVKKAESYECRKP